MTQSGIELANLRFLDYVISYYVYLVISPGNYIYHFIALGILFIAIRCSQIFLLLPDEMQF